MGNNVVLAFIPTMYASHAPFKNGMSAGPPGSSWTRKTIRLAPLRAASALAKLVTSLAAYVPEGVLGVKMDSAISNPDFSKLLTAGGFAVSACSP